MKLINRLLNWYFSKNAIPYWCILFLDCLITFVSGVLSYWLFFRVKDVDFAFQPLVNALLIYVALSLIGIRLFHTYAGIIRYSSFVDLQRVAYANIVSLVLAEIVHYPMALLPIKTFAHLNTWHVLIMYVLATLLMWAVRVSVKAIFDIATSNERAQRVLIYGAMSSGVGLAKNIMSQKPTRFVLKGFISTDETLTHKRIMGEKVYSKDEDLPAIIRNLGIEAVLVAPMKNADFSREQKLQDELINAGIRIYAVEQVKEWNGQAEDFTKVQIKEVSVEDLLPRDEIKVDLESVGKQLSGKRVLITGSAGSIGSELVRQVAQFKPAAMMLIDQAETPQHDIRLMMAKDYPDIPAEAVVTSISRQTRMEEVFSKFKPDYVFHAAAYKHVPMMEDNPSEAVLNNIYGTKVIADMSVKYGVKKFVMVSTDKAVNPTNVMGCSKRICEIYVQSLNNHQNTTQFVTTRFGNVLGSNGSVIPLFREQIKHGGPVTVTDERIVRFFMLIPEACKLVLEAGTKGHGGEIFVFDMGQPVKIADLAKRMIQLSGAQNVEIKYTGLRPGEKLYEEVLNELEGTKPTFHEKIRIAEVREYDYEAVNKDIDDLVEISKRYDDMETVRKMKEIVPEYKSNNSIYEKLDVGN